MAKHTRGRAVSYNPSVSVEECGEDAVYANTGEFTVDEMPATSDKRSFSIPPSVPPVAVCWGILLLILGLRIHFTTVLSTKLTNQMTVLADFEEYCIFATSYLTSAKDKLEQDHNQLKLKLDEMAQAQNVSETNLMDLRRENQQVKQENLQVKEENQQVKEENQQVKEENQQVKQENQQVKQENRQVKEENQQVKEENQQVKEENRQVKQENQQVKEENQQVKQENQQVKEENQQVKEENRQVKEENRQVKEENRQVKQENQQVKEENRQVKEENRQVKEENQQVKQENQQVKEENRQVKEENQQVKQENQRLRAENQRLKENNLTVTATEIPLMETSPYTEHTEIISAFNPRCKRKVGTEEMTNTTREPNKLSSLWSSFKNLLTVVATLPQREPCQASWLHFLSGCYFISNRDSLDLKTWEEARDDCRAKDADLVVVESREEQGFIYNSSLISLGVDGFWIGLRAEEGDWMWVNGSHLTEDYWTRRPADDHCCAISVKESSGWKAVNCDVKRGWICEKSALNV